MNRTLHIGPVIVLKIKQKEESIPLPTCLNENCDKRNLIVNGDTKFCSCCGTAISTKYLNKKVPIMDIWEWFEVNDFEDCLFIMSERDMGFDEGKGETYLFANHAIKGLSGGSWDVDEGTNINITRLTPENDIKLFCEYYAKEIESLNKTYGEENVKVEFRIVVTIS